LQIVHFIFLKISRRKDKGEIAKVGFFCGSNLLAWEAQWRFYICVGGKPNCFLNATEKCDKLLKPTSKHTPDAFCPSLRIFSKATFSRYKNRMDGICIPVGAPAGFFTKSYMKN
jgi:hypothetical protein